VIPSHAPSRISGLRPVCRKLPSLRGKSPLLRGFADFYQRFFGETPSQNLARPRSNINWGSQTRKRLQRPAPLKRNRSSMLRLAYPPGGTPSISLIPPKALVVVDSRQSGPPSHRHPGGQLLGPPRRGVPWGVDQFETCARPGAPSCGSLLRYAEQASYPDLAQPELVEGGAVLVGGQGHARARPHAIGARGCCRGRPRLR
jgi:hypothetical protein